MALQHSWRGALARDSQRQRRRARRLLRRDDLAQRDELAQRDDKAERRARLKLVTSPRNEASLVAPSAYRSAHGVAIPVRKQWEWLLAGIAAIGVHVGAAWILAHLPAAAVLAPPKSAPVEVAFVTPPPPPPKVEPPSPPKVQKAVKAPQVPVVEKIVQQDVTATDNVVAVQAGPPPAPPAPVEEKITAARADANYLNNPPPEYPAIALRQGWSGTVQLRVLVQPDGSPSAVAVAKSSGKKALDDAALAAVQKWKFVPAKRGDTPIEGWVSFPIEFNIEA